MKIITKNKETRICPFLKPDAEGVADIHIIVRERGTIRLNLSSRTLVMASEAARALAEALLYAAKEAEKGRDGGK